MRTIKLLGIVLSVFLSCSVWAADKKAASTENNKQVTDESGITFSNPHQAIQVSADSPEVTLTLRSNRTTGYQWVLKDYDAAILEPVSAVYHAPKASVPGAPGYATWTFRVKKEALTVPRMTQVTLQYIRPWMVTPDAQTLQFTVVIH